MGIISKDRFKEALRFYHLWNRLPTEQLRCDWTDEKLRTNEEKVLAKLAELHLPEIIEAVSENQDAA